MAKVVKITRARKARWQDTLIADKRTRERRMSRREIGIVGAERLHDLLIEIAEDENMKFGWRKRASEMLGIGYSTTCKLAAGTYTSIGTKTINAFCKTTGCAVGDLLDDDV